NRMSRVTEVPCPHTAPLEKVRRSQHVRKQRPRERDESASWFADAQHADVYWRAGGVAFRRQAGAGTADGQLRRIFRLLEKCEIGRGGLIERCNTGNAAIKVGAGPRLRAGERRDLAHAQPASPIEEKGLGHARADHPRPGGSECRPAAEPELLYPVVGFLGERE